MASVAGRQMSWEQAVCWLKSQPEKAEIVRACFYDDPLIEAAERYYNSSEWRAVRALIGPARGRTLDIGAGRGISSFALAKDGWTTVALEPDPSDEVGAGAIRRLSLESGLKLEVVESWGESLPFDSNAFELVHCRQMLHHARDLGKLCREIMRVLKPGGIMIATREHVLSHREDLAEFLRNHPLHHLYGGENAYLLREYLAAIEAGGLRLISVLNPFQSDINAFPETVESIKERLARKLHLPSAGLIPKWAMAALGGMMRTPGRSYTFIARK